MEKKYRVVICIKNTRNCGLIEHGNCFKTLCIRALNKDNMFVNAPGRWFHLPTFFFYWGSKWKEELLPFLNMNSYSVQVGQCYKYIFLPDSENLFFPVAQIGGKVE